MDKTIKIWDPVARPYKLTHPKPSGSSKHTGEEEEYTQSNEPFGEIKRIYTGEQVCAKLHAFAMKVPVPNLGGESGFSGKMIDYELLLTMNLSKPQLMAKAMKSPGYIRGYSIERMQIEIPTSRVDDVIPRKYYKELEEFAVEKRRKALVYLQTQLPMALESLKVKGMMKFNSIYTHSCL